VLASSPRAAGLYLVNDRSSPETLAALEAAVAGARDVFQVHWACGDDLRGYTRAANAGLRAALGQDFGVAPPVAPYDAFVFLNSDAEVGPGVGINRREDGRPGISSNSSVSLKSNSFSSMILDKVDPTLPGF